MNKLTLIKNGDKMNFQNRKFSPCHYYRRFVMSFMPLTNCDPVMLNVEPTFAAQNMNVILIQISPYIHFNH